MNSEKDKRGGIIPSDWTDHIAKTLITLVLGGLGTLMSVSGSFLLSEQPRLQKFSAYTTTANEGVAKITRSRQFAEAALAAYKQVPKRFTRLHEYLDSHKNRYDAELQKIVITSSEEVAVEAGQLAGYTPETTGLSPAFHESVHGFFTKELEFWRTLDDAVAEIQKNPRTGRAKLFETHDRLENLLYASSLLSSSWEDMAKAVNLQAARNIELSQSMTAEVNHETLMIDMAKHVLRISALSFIMVVLLLLLDYASKRVRWAKDKKA